MQCSLRSGRLVASDWLFDPSVWELRPPMVVGGKSIHFWKPAIRSAGDCDVWVNGVRDSTPPAPPMLVWCSLNLNMAQSGSDKCLSGMVSIKRLSRGVSPLVHPMWCCHAEARLWEPQDSSQGPHVFFGSQRCMQRYEYACFDKWSLDALWSCICCFALCPGKLVFRGPADHSHDPDLDARDCLGPSLWKILSFYLGGLCFFVKKIGC